MILIIIVDWWFGSPSKNEPAVHTLYKRFEKTPQSNQFNEHRINNQQQYLYKSSVFFNETSQVNTANNNAGILFFIKYNNRTSKTC